MNLKKVVGTTNFVVLFLVLITLQVSAQTAKNIDSLFLIEGYLLEIKTAVNAKQLKDEKIKTLERLIKKGSDNEVIFKRNLNAALPENMGRANDMVQLYHYILQSAALYKQDLKVASVNSSEKQYLNKNIPFLVDKIYRYCAEAKQLRSFKTH